MKNSFQKSFFLLFISFMTLSCSNDSDSDIKDNENSRLIKMTVNGTELIFDEVINTIVETDFGYNKLAVTATIKDTPGVTLFFDIRENQQGEVLDDFRYTENGIVYEDLISANFNFIVTENNSSIIKATFSGDVQETNGGTGLITITEGDVNINL